MGMAASQARLLTITARLADNELRSQTINNAKMRLATQSSQASENYVNALNNATMKFTNYDATGASQIQPLTYNALTAYSSYNTQYGLVNSSGQILVSESEAALFQKAGGNLNSYLQYHGLEYTTTYFEELGGLKNELYPAPFNNISVEELKGYYEGYNSYENSVEVEAYEKNYAEYLKASSALGVASQLILDEYLLNGPSSKINKVDEAITMDFGINRGMSNLLNYFKSQFLGNNSQTYNLENLKNSKLISDSLYESLKNEINSYEYGKVSQTAADGTVSQKDAIKYTDSRTITKAAVANEDGSYNYTLSDGITVTVGTDGLVSAIDTQIFDDHYATATDASGVVNYPKKSDGTIENTLSLEQFIDQMSYTLSGTNEDGSTWSMDHYYDLTTDAEGKQILNSYAYITDETEVKTALNEATESIIDQLIQNINYENFAKWVTTQNPNVLQTTYGIDINQEIKSLSGKTVQEVLQEYLDAKNQFLNNIFSTEVIPDSNPAKKYTDQVNQDLIDNYTFTITNENGEEETLVVTAENLTDIDFVLKYLQNRNLKQSESFNTVIKEYLIDEMIAVNGEPKYAWVDENDTSNTGNADAKAQWYTNLFKRMQEGYKALENGLASSSEWMEFALESGIVTLEQVDKSFKWNGLDYKTCTMITEETDDAAVTKAEAEYNRAMNDIEAKDNIYDLELKNIDTEHTSLQTEYDSIKGVISKNIERTFKFNQSA